MGLFDRVKKEEDPEKVENNIPVDIVISLKNKGLSNQEIISQLRAEGYKLEQIRDALYQADIKQGVTQNEPKEKELPPLEAEELKLPELPELPPLETTDTTSKENTEQENKETTETSTTEEKSNLKLENNIDIESLIETIVEEKYKDWKDKLQEINNDIENLSEKINNLENNLENLKTSFEEYKEESDKEKEEFKKSTEGIGVEMEAFQKVMQTLIPPLTEGIRELKESLEMVKKTKIKKKKK